MQHGAVAVHHQPTLMDGVRPCGVKRDCILSWPIAKAPSSPSSVTERVESVWSQQPDGLQLGAQHRPNCTSMPTPCFCWGYGGWEFWGRRGGGGLSTIYYSSVNNPLQLRQQSLIALSTIYYSSVNNLLQLCQQSIIAPSTIYHSFVMNLLQLCEQYIIAVSTIHCSSIHNLSQLCQQSIIALSIIYYSSVNNPLQLHQQPLIAL